LEIVLSGITCSNVGVESEQACCFALLPEISPSSALALQYVPQSYLRSLADRLGVDTRG
jgi:hypothetical protein